MIIGNSALYPQEKVQILLIIIITITIIILMHIHDDVILERPP